jgi:cytochrome c oxidase subunit 2
MNFSFPTFPEAQSKYAQHVDWLYAYLNAVTVFFTILIAALVIAFVVKYRRKGQDDRVPHEHEGKWLEIVGSVIPFALAMVMFFWGAKLHFNNRIAPDNAMEILVTGKQWMWKIQHPNGKREINELHVPAGQPIKLTMTSEDVIHSFYVPNLRIKQDVLFGRYTRIWFEADKVGNSHLFCAEFCGTEHSVMVGTVYVMPPAEYQAWLTGEGGVAGESPIEAGEKLFTSLGCVGCHFNGTQPETPPLQGPSLAGVFGREEELNNGEMITVDEDYLRESILNPNAKIVKPYRENIMPTFKGQVTESQLMQIIEYMKSLEGGAKTAESKQSAAGS